MSKRRDKKISKHNEVVIQYLDGLESRLKKIDEDFTEAEGAKDAALKIVKLKYLQSDIIDAKSELSAEVKKFAEHRAHRIKTGHEKFMRILNSPSPESYPYTATFEKSVTRNAAELREQNPRLVAHEEALEERSFRVATMLNKTVRYCDLNEISRSSWFTDAFNDSNFLRQRFEAAAAAKGAVGEETPAPNDAGEPAVENLIVRRIGWDDPGKII